MRSNISPISPGELFSILDDTSNQERRRFYRERPELPDRSGMVLLVDGKRLEREIIDLSVHGACFVLAPEDQYVPGQELHVEVRLAGDYARTRLRILHSREQGGRRLLSGHFIYDSASGGAHAPLPAALADAVLDSLSQL